MRIRQPPNDAYRVNSEFKIVNCLRIKVKIYYRSGQDFFYLYDIIPCLRAGIHQPCDWRDKNCTKNA